jgi:hypothetical protein
MKTTVFALLAFGLCAQAYSITSLSTTDGSTYNNITTQRVDPDGLYIEYTLPGGGVGMSKIKFSRLTPDQQKQFGFDAGKAHDYEASVAKANEDFRQDALRMDQLSSAARQTREADNERVLEQRATVRSQLNAAQMAPQYVPLGGPAYDYSSLGGGYGLYALPRVSRHMPKNGTTYAPVVTPIPFPRVNTPNYSRPAR